MLKNNKFDEKNCYWLLARYNSSQEALSLRDDLFVKRGDWQVEMALNTKWDFLFGLIK